VDQWKSLKGKIDEQRYQEVLARLEYQAGHAIVWRDAVCQWFLKMSGVPDRSGRAGNYPNRVEAESMKLDGYEIMDVKPWETASRGKAIQCVSSNRMGTASFVYNGKPGWFNLAVQYFDQAKGVSQFTVFVAGQKIDQWAASDRGLRPNVPPIPNGHTSMRHVVQGVVLRPGNEVRINGVAAGGETACLDYVEIDPVDERQIR
jgi:alpha-glucuronidase